MADSLQEPLAVLVQEAMRPRVAFKGTELTDELFAMLRQLCPTSYDGRQRPHSEHESETVEVFASAEIDLLVIVGKGRDIGGAPNVLRIGGQGLKTPHREIQVLQGSQVADFDPAIEQLKLALQDSEPPFDHVPLPMGHLRNMATEPPRIPPTRNLVSVGGLVVAGLWKHESNFELRTTCLAEPMVWLRCFLTFLSTEDPEAVPHPPPLLSQPEDWYTAEEHRIQQDLVDLRAECDQLAEQIKTKEADLVAANAEADSTDRLCLFENGEPLVAAVIDLLQGLGFEVEDMDLKRAGGEAKREDLRLTVDGDPSWEAIVEIKGFKKGARTNELSQLNRHAMAYAAEAGKPPYGRFWIVNQFRHEDPSERPDLSQEVRTQSVAIDVVAFETRFLYRLAQQVEQGQLTPAQARDQLRQAEPGLLGFE